MDIAKLKLSDALEIARGSERVVYIHPENPSLCIKIRYQTKRSRNESEREFSYMQSLKKRMDISDLPFALPIEWVDTNLGPGLVCPLIKGEDGKVATNLAKDRTHPKLELLVDEFCQNLLSKKISVIDLVSGNLVIAYYQGREQVVMIDGFGFTNDFLKLLYHLTPAITQRQTQRRVALLKKRFGFN
ncbi:hypothetical protein BCT35_12350 [Vibrio lentus]|uniref:YrbL family protein n=1 Tax=Vibrio lentus TaxID=136468 RepID=UPI000C835F5F|nr:YrbL family protein [Vibrio lentus]PMG18060.1 hypothetical protein BCU96_12375 [Vibrio lentus]PMH14612.1 hypothetical protein BCU76_16805 [Vibrio lentus]PMI38439.1 hypothetical protein BCU45_07545 [Vibrio lentus]PMI66428.1 hypothetical protein BCU40_09405 [Vibrio lentus]PMJ59282.1 hypothetical protein BCU20_01725 [Vibrio lentus]